ncbi:MAG TPA: hypothetical protein VJX67_13455, partial [Blastocatellia bacterium]|nr:hypothetical protein [Blastocatellia bacterium]
MSCSSGGKITHRRQRRKPHVARTPVVSALRLVPGLILAWISQTKYLYTSMESEFSNGGDPSLDRVQDEIAEIDLLVRRSDEDLAAFDPERIIEALVREASLDRDLATQISVEVRESIQKLGLRALSSSVIRGLVDAKLLELGLEGAHHAHTRLGVASYDVHRIICSSPASASQAFGPEGTSLTLAEAIKREYAIQNVFSEHIANAHLVGD